jgi:hypothetical protein
MHRIVAFGPPGGVALHAARIGGGLAAHAVLRRGGEAAFRPFRPDLDDVAAARKLLARRFGTRLRSPARRARRAARTRSGSARSARPARRSPPGGSCRVDVAQEELRDPLVLLVAAGRPPGQVGLRRRAAPWSARASCAAACRRERRRDGLSSSQNICARVPRQKPSSGMTGEDCSQPPDGVAETMLPSRSTMSKWQVSPPEAPRRPTVGSPAPGAATSLRGGSARLVRPRAEAFGCPGAAPARRLLADQLAALGVVGVDSSVAIGTSTKFGSP